MAKMVDLTGSPAWLCCTEDRSWSTCLEVGVVFVALSMMLDIILCSFSSPESYI